MKEHMRITSPKRDLGFLPSPGLWLGIPEADVNKIRKVGHGQRE